MGGGRRCKGLNGEAEREGVVRGAGQSWGFGLYVLPRLL